VLGEQPVVTVEVLGRVLSLGVNRDVWLLQNLGVRRLRLTVMRVDVVDEYRQALRSVAELLRPGRAGSRAFHHDVRFAETHLRAAQRLAIALVLLEANALLSQAIASERF
jgi:hypothetical protein